MRIRIGGVVFVLLVIGGVVFFATRTGTHESLDIPTKDTAQKTAPVAVSHTFKKGVHTFTGERVLGTPCDTLGAEAVLVEEGRVEVRITETPAEGMCLVRPTTMTFSASVEAPENASVVVLVNGEQQEAIIE